MKRKKSRIRETQNLLACAVSSTDTIKIPNVWAFMQILLCIHANSAVRPCKFRPSMQILSCINANSVVLGKGLFKYYLIIFLAFFEPPLPM